MASRPDPPDLPERLDALLTLVVLLLAEVVRLTPKRRHAERDARIVALRTGDRRRWTYRALGEAFDMTGEAARKACKRAGL